MMYRLLVALIALGLAGPAYAEPRAGTLGTITAWDSDQTRVLEVRTCPRTRDGWDYATCGRDVRQRMLTRVCARRGRGRHAYYLQLGDGPRTKATVTCED